MKSICFIFNKPPYGDHKGRELLDICLMSAAFDMPITVIFKSQGVYQLLQNQQPDVISVKNHSATFKALDLYGVENILVESESLLEHNLKMEQLLPIAEAVSQDVVKHQIASSDFVIGL